jgi:hypothetical protein
MSRPTDESSPPHIPTPDDVLRRLRLRSRLCLAELELDAAVDCGDEEAWLDAMRTIQTMSAELQQL